MIAQLDMAQLNLASPAWSSDFHDPLFIPNEKTEAPHPPASGNVLQIEGFVQVVTAQHRSFFTQILAQALRSAGQGTPVLVVQFLKGGIHQGPDHPVQLGQCLEWYRCNCQSSLDPHQPHRITEGSRRSVQALWHHVQRLILGDRYEIVILDELSLALKLDLIPEAEVIRLLQHRPRRVELILTGPEMPPSLLRLADQVTELRRPLRF